VKQWLVLEAEDRTRNERGKMQLLHLSGTAMKPQRLVSIPSVLL